MTQESLPLDASTPAVEPGACRYRKLFQTLSAGAALCRMEWVDDTPVDWIYLDVNPAFLAQTGIPAAPGKRLSEVAPGFAEKDRDLMELYGRVAAGGPPQSFERYVGPWEMWLEGNVLPAGPSEFFSVFNVITERKRMEADLKQSRADLAAAQRISHVGSWRWNLADDTITWSDELFRIHGLEPCAQAPTVAEQAAFVDAQTIAQVSELIAHAVASGEPTVMEYDVRRADGTVRRLRANIEAVTAPDGAISLIGTSMDVTERAAATAALADREELLEQVDAMAKIGGWELDLETTEVTYSRETARIHEVDWPYVPERLSDGHEYYPPEAWSVIQAAVQAAIEHGTSYDLESPFITKKGRHIWVRVQAVRVMKDGKPTKLRGTFQDITERRAAQEEIRALNATLEARVLERTARLQAANDELETFSYSVSHDLRAPLRAISGFSELLARRYRDKLDERGRTYVDTIVCSVDHMSTLIDELLEYARLGRSVVRAEPVPLEPLVAGLRAIFAERIGATGATFVVAEPLATPVADPVLLERILANLIDNALTYHRPDVAPELVLSATGHGRSVTLALADHGIGIPAEFQERIFEVFTRLHDEDVYEGTGIGLAIVRKAARLMDSDVTLVSVVGEGSTFSLDLPAGSKRA